MRENVTLPALARYATHGLVSVAKERAGVSAVCNQLHVKAASIESKTANLSGGNQQKVVLAKWLQTKPALILRDEPTQGVDIGARQTVYRAIRRAAEEGAAVLCASSDYEQLATICDRVLIFSRGEILGELAGSAISKEAIAEQCYQSIANVLHADKEAEAS